MSEDNAVNLALAEAVRRIERLEGNDLYVRAWKRAARVVKDLIVEFNNSIMADGKQISSLSSRPVTERPPGEVSAHPPGGLCPRPIQNSE